MTVGMGRKCSMCLRRLVWGNGGVLVFRQEGVEQQQACAGDDGAVGQIEVGPVVPEDMDLNEVDDRSIGDAIVEVSQSAA